MNNLKTVYHCVKCGSEIKEIWLKCPKCGAFLASDGAFKTEKVPRNKTEELNGIDGWLVWFIIALFGSMIITLFSYAIITLDNFETQSTLIQVMVYADFVIMVALPGYIAYLFIKKFPQAISSAKFYLWLILVTNIINVGISFVTNTEFKGNILFNFINPSIWLLYFYNSKRVEVTFPETQRKNSLLVIWCFAIELGIILIMIALVAISLTINSYEEIPNTLEPINIKQIEQIKPIEPINLTPVKAAIPKPILNRPTTDPIGKLNYSYDVAYYEYEHFLTYTQKLNKFKIRFPDNWGVNNNPEYPAEVMFFSQFSNENDMYAENVVILVVDLGDEFNDYTDSEKRIQLRDYYLETFPQLVTNYKFIYDGLVEVNKNPAYEIAYSGSWLGYENSATFLEVSIIKDNTLYKLVYSGQEDFYTYLPVAEKIIASIEIR